MRAGKLRHYVTLFAPPPTLQPDDLGDMSQCWTESGNAWAAIEPGAGREFWMAQATRAELSHTITMRYDPRIGPRWRVMWNDGHRCRTFEIGPPVSPEERQFMMTFAAVEKWDN